MRRVVAAVSILVLCLTFAPAAPVPKEVAPPAYFPTHVGAKWVWKTRDSKITQSVTEVKEKDGTITVAVCWENDGKISAFGTFLVTDKGLFAKVYLDHKLDPPICLLKHPPKAGDKWESRAGISSDLFELDWKCKVLELEWVEVPAGKFKAFPVVSEITVTPKVGPAKQENSKPLVRTEWYAPGVGCVKRKQKWGMDDDVQVLESFTPAK